MRLVFVCILMVGSFSFYGLSSDTLFEQGINQLASKEYQEAENTFLKLSNSNPSFASFYNLGVASGKSKNWSQAKWAFESALKYAPLNKKAAFNARFSTKKLNQKIEWSNPYSWLMRIILKFGSITWFIIGVLSSLIIGYILFKVIRASSFKEVIQRNGIWQIGLSALILFILATSAILTINRHFNKKQFALLKNPYVNSYVSPNGVKLEQKAKYGQRLKIIRFSKNKEWVQLTSEENRAFWVKDSSIYTY